MTKSGRIKKNSQYNPFTRPMVTGHGVKGSPDGVINYENLVLEATLLTDDERQFDWQSVSKEKAQWFLPSTLASRKSAEQVADGSYAALVIDIDSGRSTFEDVEKAVLVATGGAVALVHSTKSATFSTPRWRVIIPLERPLPGVDYADTAKSLYDRVRAASDGRVDPDDAGARPGQIFFLPNAPDGDPGGEDYLIFAAEIGDDPDLALDLADDHPIVRLREKHRRQERQKAEAAAEQARHRRQVGTTPIGRFNAHHRIDKLLNRYRYIQATDPSGRWPTDHWRSPYQTSGSYATRVYRADDGAETWVSLSGSDAKRGLGPKSASGGASYGDAFDLYAHFEHGGDIAAALEAWKAQCDEHRHVEVAQSLAHRDAKTSALHNRLRALGRHKN